MLNIIARELSRYKPILNVAIVFLIVRYTRVVTWHWSVFLLYARPVMQHDCNVLLRCWQICGTCMCTSVSVFMIWKVFIALLTQKNLYGNITVLYFVTFWCFRTAYWNDYTSICYELAFIITEYVNTLLAGWKLNTLRFSKYNNVRKLRKILIPWSCITDTFKMGFDAPFWLTKLGSQVKRLAK